MTKSGELRFTVGLLGVLLGVFLSRWEFAVVPLLLPYVFIFLVLAFLLSGVNISNLRRLVRGRAPLAWVMICVYYFGTVKFGEIPGADSLPPFLLRTFDWVIFFCYPTVFFLSSLRSAGTRWVPHISYVSLGAILCLLWVPFTVSGIKLLGEYVNWNYFAYILYIFICMSLVALVSSPARGLRFSFKILLVAAAVAVVLTGSRGVVLAVVALGFLYVATPYLFGDGARVAKIVPITFLSVSLVIYIYYYVGLYFVDSKFWLMFDSVGEGKSVWNRLPIWSEIIGRMGDYLVFGRCSNCKTEFFFSEAIGRNLSSHSMYLEILFRGGMVFFLLIAYLFYSIIRDVSCTGRPELSRVCSAVLLSSLVLGLFHDVIFFGTPVVNVLFWALIGDLYGAAVLREPIRS